MAGHSRWKTRQARRLAETGDACEHPEYEQAGRDLRLGDQLRAIRRSRNLAQKEVAERAGIEPSPHSRTSNWAAACLTSRPCAGSGTPWACGSMSSLATSPGTGR